MVGANIRCALCDVVGFVDDASAQLGARVPLPAGYRYELGRTSARRSSVSPSWFRSPYLLAIYLQIAAFQRVRQAALVLANVPFGAGGRGGRPLDHRAQPESLGIDRVHRALRNRGLFNGIVMVSRSERPPRPWDRCRHGHA